MKLNIEQEAAESAEAGKEKLFCLSSLPLLPPVQNILLKLFPNEKTF
jgi:hypothetical protein